MLIDVVPFIAFSELFHVFGIDVCCLFFFQSRGSVWNQAMKKCQRLGDLSVVFGQFDVVII